jgi:peptide/nickel transport system substrate-binding protein
MRCAIAAMSITAAGAINLAALAVNLAALAGCTRTSRIDRTGMVTVSAELTGSWVRNFNPLMPPGSARWPTTGGIYEPLLIYNTMTGQYVDWLGASYVWSEGNTRLTFTVRDGVSWSDGQPLTASDVAFTFDLLRRYRALDSRSTWEFLKEVRAVDRTHVQFDLARAYVPGLYYVGQQPIVPAHVWKDIPDPVSYPNENPVATGPFTEVESFRDQVFVLGRNPHYWQPGKPAVTRLRMPAYPGNDEASLALVADQIDWAGNFIPDIGKVYDKRDPAHHHHWFPLVASPGLLYANGARAPFDDARVRKAVSMAIDRARIVRVAVYDYTRPADATGLSDAHAAWRSEASVKAGAGWVTYDPKGAEALLDEAGLRRHGGGMRTKADGSPLRVDINVVSGWSDWVRAAQIIASSLQDVGVDARLHTFDFGAFFDQLQRGQYDLSFGWANDGPTPYTFYRHVMSARLVKPVGEQANECWTRWGSQEADEIFRAFEVATDPAELHRLVDRLQAIFVENAPAIPLYLRPEWGEFNSARLLNFPDPQHPYAKPAPNDLPEALLVLTELAPR